MGGVTIGPSSGDGYTDVTGPSGDNASSSGAVTDKDKSGGTVVVVDTASDNSSDALQADDHLDLDTGRWSGDSSIMDGLVVRLIGMYGDIQSERFQGVIDELDSNSDQIEANSQKRMDEFSEQIKAQAKLKKANKKSTILAGIGIGVAGLLMVGSLGSASGASLALMTVCAGSMIANSAMDLSGAYDRMPSKTAMGMRIGLASVGVAAAIGCGGMSLLSSIEETSEAAASTTLSMGEAAGEAGAAGADATTSAEAADTLVNGVMRVAQAAESAEGTDAGLAEVVVDTDMADLAPELSDIVDTIGDEGTVTADDAGAGSDVAEDDATEPDADDKGRWKTASDRLYRGAKFLDAVDKSGQTAVNIDKAVVQRQLSRIDADLTEIAGDAEYYDALRQHITDLASSVASDQQDAANTVLKVIVSSQHANSTLARNMKL